MLNNVEIDLEMTINALWHYLGRGG